MFHKDGSRSRCHVRQEPTPRFSPTGAYITDFSTIYSAALYRAPLYNVLLQDIPPMLCYPEACRTCQREGQFTYLLAVYEGTAGRRGRCTAETCQRADWRRRKVEHAGTQPWGVSRFGHCSAAFGEREMTFTLLKRLQMYETLAKFTIAQFLSSIRIHGD